MKTKKDVEEVLNEAMGVVFMTMRSSVNQQRFKPQLPALYTRLVEMLTLPEVYGGNDALVANNVELVWTLGGLCAPESLRGVVATHPKLLHRLVELMEQAEATASAGLLPMELQPHKMNNVCMRVLATLCCSSNVVDVAADDTLVACICDRLSTFMLAANNSNPDGASSALKDAMDVLLALASSPSSAAASMTTARGGDGDDNGGSLARLLRRHDKHSSTLLSALAAVLNLRWVHYPTQAAGAAATVKVSHVAGRVVYDLSVNLRNQPVMRTSSELRTALEKISEAATGRNDPGSVKLYASLALINIWHAVDDGDSTTTTTTTKNNASLVYKLLSEGVANSRTDVLVLALLSLRFQATERSLRAEYWARHSAVLVEAIKLLIVLEPRGSGGGGGRKQNLAVHDGLTVLAQFSNDSAPRDAMRSQFSGAISALVARAGAVSTAAGKMGIVVMRRLGMAQAAAEARLALDQRTIQAMLQTMLPSASPVLVDLLHSGKKTELLSTAISLGAPLELIEALVASGLHYGVAAASGEHQPSSTLLPLLAAMQRCESVGQDQFKNAVSVALLLIDREVGELNCHDNEGMTPLMLSCQYAELLPITQRLVEKQRDDVVDLDYANDAGTSLIFCVNQEDNAGYAQAQCLLQAGASANQGAMRDADDEWTPLLSAIFNTDVRMIQLLLKHGADVTLTEDYIWTWLACGYESDLTEALFDQFLDMLVAQDEKNAETAGAPSAVTGSPGLFARFYDLEPDLPRRALQRWILLGADVTDALHVAAVKGYAEDVALFLQLGAGPNRVQEECVYDEEEKAERTNFVVPALSALRNMDKPKENMMNIVRMLIKAGADLSSSDDDDDNNNTGEEILALAVEFGSAVLTDLLMQAGALGGNGEEEDSYGGGGGGIVAQLRDQILTMCAQCRRTMGSGGGGDTEELHPCSGCVMVAYCDEQCQTQHWAKHKPVCRKKREMDEKRRRASEAGDYVA